MSDLIITELKGSETASRLAQSFYEIHNNSAVGKYNTQCLKMTKKVSFNIASEVYILSGQKFIKNAKNGPNWQLTEKLNVK